MSDYLDDAERAKIALDKVSPTMCLAKWKQVSFHLPSGLNNSCYHPPLHKIDVNAIKTNPSALHNTEQKKRQRQMMMEGKRPPECSYCWNIEDTGNMSDRHYRSGEPWALDKYDEIVSAGAEGDVVPSYVEVNFSNVCNLECSYCSPQFSSTWKAQTERYGAYPTTVPHNAPEHFEKVNIPNRDHNPYVEAFWNWWPELYPELRHFRMTGGEPMMDKNTYRVFDYILENPKPDLHINTTSNFSVDPALFEKYLDYAKRLCTGETVEHFMQFVSVDTWGEQAEYIRPGLNFDRLKKNVERFLTEIPGRNSVTFIITMNNLSIPGIQNFLKWIIELRAKHSTTYQRVWFDTPLLRQPQWQSLQIMPESYAWKLEQVLKWMEAHQINEDIHEFVGFKDFEIAKMRRDIAWMRNPHPNLNIQRLKKDFYLFFKEHDHRHKTVFTEVFPEMTDFWAECKYYAESL
jgi:MoaA/NifB/PqqE/SkfB family radical SAM enzyme